MDELLRQLMGSSVVLDSVAKIARLPTDDVHLERQRDQNVLGQTYPSGRIALNPDRVSLDPRSSGLRSGPEVLLHEMMHRGEASGDPSITRLRSQLEEVMGGASVQDLEQFTRMPTNIIAKERKLEELQDVPNYADFRKMMAEEYMAYLVSLAFHNVRRGTAERSADLIESRRPGANMVTSWVQERLNPRPAPIPQLDLLKAVPTP